MNDLLVRTFGRRVLFGYGWLALFFIIAPVFILIPISFSAESAFVFPPKAFSLEWYKGLIENPRWRQAAGVSLQIAAIATILAVTLGVPAAIGMSRLGPKAGRFVKILFIAPMVLPVMVLGVAFYVLFSRIGMLGSFWSLSLAHTVLILPFVVIPVTARLMTADPALERAAASLGAGPVRALWLVVVPILIPAVAAGVVFGFLHSFDEVVMAQFLSGPRLETLPRRIWESIAIGGLDKTLTAVTTIQIALTVVLLLSIIYLRPGKKGVRTSQRETMPANDLKSDNLARPSTATTTKSVKGVGITFDRVAMRYGGKSGAYAVRDFSLDINPAEFLTVLGPSGSGKTTVLMLVAGFIAQTNGRLLLGDRDISTIAPHKRNLGIVFQNYALFPHLDVRQNVAFPLRIRGVPSAEIAKRVDRALAQVHMAEYGDRRITQLSGGQQQRVALARSIIFNPDALLMDEPLAALDKNLRLDMQHEIRTLQRSLSQTVIYVTHDQEEALNLSDRIVVMDKGFLQQVATPREIYQKPANRFVANFFGEANLFDGEAAGQQLLLAEGSYLPLPERKVGQTTLCVRPEAMDISSTSFVDGPNISGIVIEARFQGSVLRIRVGTAFGELVVVQQGRPNVAAPAVGSTVFLSWDVAASHAM